VTLDLARIRKLKTLARDGLLEVEHVVEVAVSGNATDVPLLEDLLPSDRSAGILLDWKLAAIHFLQGGCDALETYAEQASRFPFVIGILENVRTVASVSCVLALSTRFPESGYRLAEALNLILSFNGPPILPTSVAAQVRTYLEDLAQRADSEPNRAVAILALRGVGDASTLAFLKTVPAFSLPYQNTLQATRKAIQRRIALPPLSN
jgi:hypothetical protein